MHGLLNRGKSMMPHDLNNNNNSKTTKYLRRWIEILCVRPQVCMSVCLWFLLPFQHVWHVCLTGWLTGWWGWCLAGCLIDL